MAELNAKVYNEIAAAMHLFEESEILTKEEVKRRRENAIEKQTKKARILQYRVYIIHSLSSVALAPTLPRPIPHSI